MTCQLLARRAVSVQSTLRSAHRTCAHMTQHSRTAVKSLIFLPILSSVKVLLSDKMVQTHGGKANFKIDGWFWLAFAWPSLYHELVKLGT